MLTRMRFLIATLSFILIASNFSRSHSNITEEPRLLSILNPLEGDEIKSGHSIIFEVLVDNVSLLPLSSSVGLFLDSVRVVLIQREELSKQDGIVKWNVDDLLPGYHEASAELLVDSGMHDGIPESTI